MSRKNWKQRIEKWLSVSVRRRFLDSDLQKSQNLFEGRVLEIGAGRLGRRGEFSPPRVAEAAWLTLDLRRNGNPDLQATLHQLPIERHSIDTLVCLEVLEYVEDPDIAISEMHRTLKSEATLILSAPFIHRQDAEEDLWRFTRTGIEGLLSRNGFLVIKTLQQGSAVAVIASILKYWLNLHANRLWLGRFARPMIQWLLKLDAVIVRNFPQLETFSTGFLVIARSRS